MRKSIIAIFIIIGAIKGKDIKEFRISNGILCLYLQKEAPTFSLAILIKGGVTKLSEAQDGIEYLTLKTIIKGTKKIPYPFLYDTLENYGIEIRTSSFSDYSLINFKSIKKFIPEAIKLAGEILKEPEFSQKAFERAKEEIITEIQKQKEDPDEEIWDMLNKEFYRKHTYIIKPEGKIETIEKLSLEKIREYYKNHFNSNEIIIGFAGDVEKNEIQKLLEGNFSEIKKGDYKDREVPSLILREGKIIKNIREDLQTSYMACKFPAPPPSHKEYPSLYLLMRVLSHRLWSTLRTEHGLTYSTYAGLSRRKVNYGYMYFSSVYPDSAFELLNKEIEKIKSEKVSLEEIGKTINSTKTSFYNRIASVDRLTETILSDKYLTGDSEYSFKIFERVKKISPEELVKMAQKYLKKQNFFIAFLIKKTLK